MVITQHGLGTESAVDMKSVRVERLDFLIINFADARKTIAWDIREILWVSNPFDGKLNAFNPLASCSAARASASIFLVA